MSVMSIHLATLMPFAATAALLTLTLGTRKLSLKRAPRRCPACGRIDRRGCQCRR